MNKRNASLSILIAAALLAGGYFFFRPSDNGKPGVSPATSAVQDVTNRTTRHDSSRSLETPGNAAAENAARFAEVKELLELRKTGKMDEYIRRTRSWLETNRVDLLATDLMTLYARSGNTNEFHAFGIQYATNSPDLLLEFADIADNEHSPEMNAAFALKTAQAPGATFAQLYRSVRFLLDAGSQAELTPIAAKLETLAAKRYQYEDVTLLKCELAVKQGTATEKESTALLTLSREAVMPEVRRNAEKLLAQLKQEQQP